MKLWLKKLFPTRESIKKSNELKYLARFLKSSDLWSFDMLPVARGVAAGLAGAVIPGFQFLYAAVLAILLRGNLVIALTGTFITNPFTALPIIYLIYWIGSLLIGNGETIEVQEFNWHFSTIHQFWDNFGIWVLQFGKAFLIGMVVISFCLGIIGYFGTILIWKITVLLFHKNKHKKRK